MAGIKIYFKHGDQVFGNSPFAQEHLEDFVPEDRLQLFQVQGRGDPEHAPSVEASVRHRDMAVRVEPEEVAKGLDGDDCTGDGILSGTASDSTLCRYSYLD